MIRGTETEPDDGCRSSAECSGTVKAAAAGWPTVAAPARSPAGSGIR